MGLDCKVSINFWVVMAMTICLILVIQIDTVHGKALATNEVDISAAAEAGTRQQNLVKRSTFQENSFATDFEREERFWAWAKAAHMVYKGVKNAIDKGR